MSERDTREDDDEQGEAVAVDVQDDDEGTEAERAGAGDDADESVEAASEESAAEDSESEADAEAESDSGAEEQDDDASAAAEEDPPAAEASGEEEPAPEGSPEDTAAEATEASSAAEGSAEDAAAGAGADAGEDLGTDLGEEFDPTDYLESQVEALRAELSAVQKELEQAQVAASQGRDQALRAKADFANFKKRKELELERLQEEKVEKVLLRVLPVYDTFGRAIDQYEKDNSEEALYDGLQRIEKMFMQLLESQGITPIEAQGKPFDPNIHEAVCRVEIPEDGFDEMVVDVFETGYIYGEKVLKASKVSVAKE